MGLSFFLTNPITPQRVLILLLQMIIIISNNPNEDYNKWLVWSIKQYICLLGAEPSQESHTHEQGVLNLGTVAEEWWLVGRP